MAGFVVCLARSAFVGSAAGARSVCLRPGGVHGEHIWHLKPANLFANFALKFTSYRATFVEDVRSGTSIVNAVDINAVSASDDESCFARLEPIEFGDATE